MKKIYLIIIALAAVATGVQAALNIDIDSGAFPDKVFRSYIKQYIDANKNDILEVSEIQKTTYIDVSTSDITDLRGIGFFTELTILYCEGCLLTTLDVSNNTKLETLYCQYNKLTSLNVSSCSALQFLNCTVNRLNMLNVSGCTSLEELYCYDNNIKASYMTRLLVGLPMNTNGKEHKLYLLSRVGDGNAITNDQLTVAKLLGWTVYRGSDKLEAKKGDVNEDGITDVADIATVIDIMAGKVVDDENAYASCPNESHPHWIDLGLPNGTQWLCCNEGASKPEDYGGYYILDEALAFNPPTKAQFTELNYNCTSEWTTLNGVYGRKYTGPNGGTIFLPAAGYFFGGYFNNVGTYGRYWSSTPGDEGYGYVFGFNSGNSGWGDNFYHNNGLSVRPVR